MGVLARTWTTRGTVIVGSVPGAPDLKLIPAQLANGNLTHAQLDDIALTLNELTANQAAVYRKARKIELETFMPASVRTLAAATDLTTTAVQRILDVLVEKGLGNRPPRGSGQRPFLTRPPLLFPEPEGPAS